MAGGATSIVRSGRISLVGVKGMTPGAVDELLQILAARVRARNGRILESSAGIQFPGQPGFQGWLLCEDEETDERAARGPGKL